MYSPSQEDFVGFKHFVLLPNGIRLAYVEWGDPGGMPVVLLHGFTDTSRSWSLIAPHLDRRFRFIAPDLRGHGHSDKPEGCYTIPEMAHDIRLVITVLGIERAHVWGHSLGGRLAQALAQRWPDAVGKLVLMSTSAVLRERSGWLWENIEALHDPIDPESQFVREWCSGVVPVDQTFLAHVRKDCATIPARIWHSIYYEQLAYDPLPLLRDILSATLILRGEQDMIATDSHQRQMKDQIAGSRVLTIPGCGHNLHWERPEAVARLVGKFLI